VVRLRRVPAALRMVPALRVRRRVLRQDPAALLQRLLAILKIEPPFGRLFTGTGWESDTAYIIPLNLRQSL